jgi:hypothetical protein
MGPTERQLDRAIRAHVGQFAETGITVDLQSAFEYRQMVGRMRTVAILGIDVSSCRMAGSGPRPIVHRIAPETPGLPTGKPAVHPLRWPGSWNLKDKPTLAKIVTLKDSAEIHLDEAVDALVEAVEAAGYAKAALPQSSDPQAPVPVVTSAMAKIPNVDEHYDTWIRYGYACYRAAGGDAGRDIWDEWSRKSSKFNATEQEAAWKRIRGAIAGSSAPRTIGAGTIFFNAAGNGWTRSKEEKNPAGGTTPRTLNIINPADLVNVPIKSREWIVEDWFPIGCVTSLYGDGGIGKTLLGQQLMTSTACSKPWCGREVMQCRSFGMFCEDDEDELHRRQAAICAAYEVSIGDLGTMRWVSDIGADNSLLTFGPDRATPTALFEAIKKAATDHGAKLIVLDPAADLFSGNENDRHQVRTFITQLNGLAFDLKLAVLLNAHPSVRGITTGQPGWRQYGLE